MAAASTGSSSEETRLETLMAACKELNEGRRRPWAPQPLPQDGRCENIYRGVPWCLVGGRTRPGQPLVQVFNELMLRGR